MSDVVSWRLTAPELDRLEAGERVTVTRDRLAVSWGSRVIAWVPAANDEKRTLLCFISNVVYGDEMRSVVLVRCTAQE